MPHLCVPPIVEQLRVGPGGEGHMVVPSQPQVIVGASWRWRVEELLDVRSTGCYVPAMQKPGSPIKSTSGGLACCTITGTIWSVPNG